MYQDTKMIRDKRKTVKMGAGSQQRQHSFSSAEYVFFCSSP